MQSDPTRNQPGVATLQIGDILETSYGTGPYRVSDILRGCTCVDCVDWINNRGIPQPPHPHITCALATDPAEADPKGRDRYCLSGYVERPDGMLESLKHGDTLRVTGKASGIQLGLGL